MSTNLYWEPKDRKKHNAGKDSALKWALQKRFGYPITKTFNEYDCSYLQCLADAGIDGAQDLIDSIEKYETIEVFEE